MNNAILNKIEKAIQILNDLKAESGNVVESKNKEDYRSNKKSMEERIELMVNNLGEIKTAMGEKDLDEARRILGSPTIWRF